LKILIVGGGGREHAIAWQLNRSPDVKALIAAPGNPGIAKLGRCIAAPASVAGYADLAESESVDLTVVGPEATLVEGIVDQFRSRGLRIVGPTRAAARLEGSKIFAKEFFSRAGIPTAKSFQTTASEEALSAVKRFTLPVVIKADGLAAGKGVIIAYTADEARRAIEALGPLLVIEEFLEGEEVSFIGLSNGQEVLPLEASQDHKRVGEGDSGPNTGGMGAYSDGRIITREQAGTITDRVMNPAIRQMAREGTPFTGFLYAGLMMTADGPKVLEFNVRLGDPETQALMHRLESGFLEALQFAAGGERAPLRWRDDPSVCVVLAAAGYPDKPRTGDVISGIEQAEASGAVVFHAGTKRAGDNLVTNGGRVLGITASGANLQQAMNNAYVGVSEIDFEGVHFRRDIGSKGLKRWQASGHQHAAGD
jgi:phosphoribosylamine--glycine ligase